MRMWLAVAILCVVRPAVADAPFGDWKRPTILESVPVVLTVGLIWSDVLQTRDGLRHGRYEENLLLGSKPTDARLFLIGGVLPTVVLTAVWYMLPPPHRTLFIATPLIIEGETVWENASKGLVIRF